MVDGTSVPSDGSARSRPGPRAVLGVGHAVEGVQGWPDLLHAVTALVAELIPCDEIAWQGVDPVHARVHVADVHDSYSAEEVELLLDLPDHPVKEHYLAQGLRGVAGDWSPVRLSDLVGERRFRATRTCQELYAPHGVRHQVVIPTMTDGPGTAASVWSLNRGGRDFDEDELRLAGLLQPLLAALEASSAWRPAGQDARTLGTWEPWVRRPGLTATVAAVEQVVLTPREQQVVDLLAEGHTARAIALRLRISERTVRKHLENVYAKTGHHDRLQVALWARRRSGPRS